MERKLFISSVIERVLTVDGFEAPSCMFEVFMHFGESVCGTIQLDQSNQTLTLLLNGKYAGWTLRMSEAGVVDNDETYSWSTFDLDAIIRCVQREVTLSGVVEVILTRMKEW